VGKIVQPLQSVNCHDSRAHGHERNGPFARLVWLWLVCSSRVTGFGWFGYKGETCELYLVWLQG
jgi:hypothetical protein